MDAIAAIFVNYREEREDLVKTEAADLIEQNVAELMQLCYRGASAGEFEIERTEWKDDASAEDEGRSREHLSARAPRRPRRLRGHLLIQFVVLPRKMGTGRDSLEVRDPRPGPLAPRAPRKRRKRRRARVPAQTDENVVTCFIDGAATLKRARKQGLLRPVAPRPLNSRVARRHAAASERLRSSRARGRPVTGRSSFRDPSESIPDDLDPVARRLQFDFVLMLCRRLGVKDAFLFATEAGAPAWLTLGFEHVGSSACSMDRALKIFSDSAGLYPMAAPPAPAPRRRAAASKKRVVDDADADDEDEAWEPGRPPNMDLDDDEQEQAAKAKRKLKRRSKKKSAKAKNAAGAAPHAPVSAPPAARPPRRPSPRRRSRARGDAAGPGPGRGGRAAAAPAAQDPRPHRGRAAVPPPPNRATGADDDSDEGWEESDEDDPVEDLIHRERIRERDLLRTPGCLALGRAFRLEDMPRVTERDRADRAARLQRLFPNHNFRLSWSVRFNVVVQTIDAIALDQPRAHARVDMEVRRSTVGVYEDSLACQLLGQTYYVHPDKTIKITVDLVVTSEVIGAFPFPRRPPSFHALARSFPLAGTAPGRAEVHIKELGFHFVDPLAPIAEKEIVPLALDDGHLIVELKYLQAMHVKNRMLKKCCYTLYLVELADRLRAEASRETLKTARKNVVEVGSRVRERAPTRPLRHGRARAPGAARVIRKFANAIARAAAEARGETFVPTPYDETAVDAVVVTAVPPVAPVATLVADGAKKVVFEYSKTGKNGSDYLKARWRGLAGDGPLRLEFDELARRRMCYRVIRDAKRRAGGHGPRAEDDACPAYYGVDFA
ncbi:2-oxoglutarate and iron dependent oxygenase [Aureococcus anophagefferens]|uniref:2-oxoglutarate and iron dependent oxygenase n=1 Tax=Aureococcus anophagefferens TaxID=44056 RepID=A0ABR1FH49_AURAN